ncbi:MAG: hypothetical protein WAW23_11505 [Candidatus Methanoperedens sp.]
MDNFIEKNLVSLIAQGINSSQNELALEALKAAKAIVYYTPLAELTQVLNNALQHKNRDVAFVSLDILRLIHETENKVKPITPLEYKKILIDAAIPFLVTCLKSSSDEIALSALNAAGVLSNNAEVNEYLFNPVEQMMLHKNKQIAYLALDIIRSMNLGKEIHAFE